MSRLTFLLLLACACASTPRSNTIHTQADYESQWLGFANETIALFTAHGEHCDQLAVELNRYIDAKLELMNRLTAWERQGSAIQRSDFETKHATTIERMGAAAENAEERCGDHAGFQAAYARIPT